jgi:RecB family exonuclease
LAIEPATLMDSDLVAGALQRGVTLLTRDATFLPDYAPGNMLEYVLGGPGGSVDLGGFRLKGRVDRVDEGPGGLVVQDYKWSRGEGHKQFGPKRLVQLPLYAAAIESLTGRSVVAAAYRTLKDGAALGYWRDDVLDGEGMRPGDRVDESEARALIQGALETARDAVSGMRAGRIEPDRSQAKTCEYCAAAAFCPWED